jgi:hypothetical protein
LARIFESPVNEEGFLMDLTIVLAVMTSTLIAFGWIALVYAVLVVVLFFVLELSSAYMLTLPPPPGVSRMSMDGAGNHGINFLMALALPMMVAWFAVLMVVGSLLWLLSAFSAPAVQMAAARNRQALSDTTTDDELQP